MKGAPPGPEGGKLWFLRNRYRGRVMQQTDRGCAGRVLGREGGIELARREEGIDGVRRGEGDLPCLWAGYQRPLWPCRASGRDESAHCGRARPLGGMKAPTVAVPASGRDESAHCDRAGG